MLLFCIACCKDFGTVPGEVVLLLLGEDCMLQRLNMLLQGLWYSARAVCATSAADFLHET